MEGREAFAADAAALRLLASLVGAGPVALDEKAMLPPDAACTDEVTREALKAGLVLLASMAYALLYRVVMLRASLGRATLPCPSTVVAAEAEAPDIPSTCLSERMGAALVTRLLIDCGACGGGATSALAAGFTTVWAPPPPPWPDTSTTSPISSLSPRERRLRDETDLREPVSDICLRRYTSKATTASTNATPTTMPAIPPLERPGSGLREPMVPWAPVSSPGRVTCLPSPAAMPTSPGMPSSTGAKTAPEAESTAAASTGAPGMLCRSIRVSACRMSGSFAASSKAKASSAGPPVSTATVSRDASTSLSARRRRTSTSKSRPWLLCTAGSTVSLASTVTMGVRPGAD